MCDAEEGDGGRADLADDLQVLVAGEGVVLQAALHLLVPVSPLDVELCQRLSATRLKAFATQGFQIKYTSIHTRAISLSHSINLHFKIMR